MIKLIESKDYKGLKLKCFELKNSNGSSVQIINYGARIHRLFMPDINGKFIDVVAGFDTIDGYLKDNPYFNAIIGRTSNRIGKASFKLNGKTYNLYKNDNGNSLHGGKEGFDKKIWETEIINDNGTEKLELTYFSCDMEENYPSDLTVKVRYYLSDNNELSIEYFAKGNGDTICSLTNHAYFNLSGDFNNTVLNEVLRIKSDKITAIDDKLIPDGTYYQIKNTPLDFNSFKSIGEEINENNEYLSICGGYDFNYVLNNDLKSYVAKAFDPKTCVEMEVYTTEPCLQLYTGNFLNGVKGKTVFNKHSAFCLETQKYPNACNVESFPNIVLKKDEEYRSKTVYKFSIFRP